MDTKQIKEIKDVWNALYQKINDEICHKYRSCKSCPLNGSDGICLNIKMNSRVFDMVDELKNREPVVASETKPLTLLEVIQTIHSDVNLITYKCPSMYIGDFEKLGYNYQGNDCTLSCKECWNRQAEKFPIAITPPPSDNIKQQFEASDMSIEDGTATGAKHYNDLPIQPIELMQTLLTTNEFIGFLKGNIIKYAMRAGHKGSPDKDKAKAQQYTDWLYEFLDSGEVRVKHD